MRLGLAGILLVVCGSCREIQQFSPASEVQGYQLDGSVTTSNGVAVDGVDVRLYYSYNYVSDTPTDTTLVVVTNPAKPVDVAVYNSDLKFIRQLFLGYKAAGQVPRFTWDGYDASGNAVPGGKYFIRYVVDTVIVKFSPVLVDGHITATTDAGGHFTFAPRNLPVGDRFDLYDFSNQYAGTYEIVSTIDITLRKGSSHASFTNIPLILNKITKNVFTIQ